MMFSLLYLLSNSCVSVTVGIGDDFWKWPWGDISPPLPHSLPSLLPSLPSSLSVPFLPSFRCPSSSSVHLPLLYFPSLCLSLLLSQSYPFIQLWVLGSALSSSESPGGARPPNAIDAFSGWNQRTFCHLHNDIFVISTVHFWPCTAAIRVESDSNMQLLAHIIVYVLLFEKKWHNKIPVGLTWGHRPHNFLAVGAIALMESAPMTMCMVFQCPVNISLAVVYTSAVHHVLYVIYVYLLCNLRQYPADLCCDCML